MQQINTKPLSGFLQLSPSDQLEFDRIRQVILEEHLKAGFSPVDVPLIYRNEVLLAKAGGETEKQIYELKRGDHNLALRFDLTVPLAAYIAENQSELSFPFKVSQINKVYRGERSQFARLREFYQCDADVVGRETLSVSYDAEVINLVNSIYKRLGFGEFTIRISNRKLLTGFLNSVGLGEKLSDVMAAVDRAEKISSDEFKGLLSAIGLDQSQLQRISDFISIEGSNDEIIGTLEGLGVEDSSYKEGLVELKEVLSILRQMGSESNIKIDLMIVRGLDYYTGTVFETILVDHKEVGSIASGGRYDNLVSKYSNEKFPGVGASIGLSRLFVVLKEKGIVSSKRKSPTDILIIPFSADQLEYCYGLAQKIRQSGKNVDILSEDMSFKRKMKYADKSGIENLIVVGENEIQTGELKQKNMFTGEESIFSL